MYKVCFRGDTRPADRIFVEGFRGTRPGLDIAYNRYPGSFGHLIKDVRRGTAVCMSGRFQVAAIFPVPSDLTHPERQPSKSPTTIFVMAVPVSSLINVQLEQHTQALANMHTPGFTSERARRGLYYYGYGHELAAHFVRSNEIIGAIEVVRHYTGGSEPWSHYTWSYYSLVGEFRANPRCTVPEQYVAAAHAFMREECHLRRFNQPIPRESGGYRPVAPGIPWP